jgi:hypothetical protein
VLSTNPSTITVAIPVPSSTHQWIQHPGIKDVRSRNTLENTVKAAGVPLNIAEGHRGVDCAKTLRELINHLVHTVWLDAQQVECTMEVDLIQTKALKGVRFAQHHLDKVVESR